MLGDLSLKKWSNSGLSSAKQREPGATRRKTHSTLQRARKRAPFRDSSDSADLKGTPLEKRCDYGNKEEEFECIESTESIKTYKFMIIFE